MRKRRKTDKPLTEEDWRIIESLRLSDNQKAILQFLKDDTEVSVPQLEGGNFGLYGSSKIDAINQIFRKAGLNYLISGVANAVPWTAKILKVYIVE